MITLENFQFSYKKRQILDIDKFVINDGDKIAFMGRNGAGKTTLAELILGVKTGYKGTIKKTKKYRSNAVFQDQAFTSDVSLKDIFYLYSSLYKIKKDPQFYFDLFEMSEVQKNVYKKISGGQQQKFKFLIALLNEPDFLLLDEISTGLDYVWRKKIIEQITKELEKQADKTLILVSHDPGEIAALCNRVILLENGRIAKDFSLNGSIEEKKKQLEGLVIENV